MKRYRIEYEGVAYVNADSEEEAQERLLRMVIKCMFDGGEQKCQN